MKKFFQVTLLFVFSLGGCRVQEDKPIAPPTPQETKIEVRQDLILPSPCSPGGLVGTFCPQVKPRKG